MSLNPLRIFGNSTVPELWTCPQCGALCYSRHRQQHESWHLEAL